VSALHLAVVGAGAAGTAAAWAAARAGARVSVFSAQAGATELYSGALDFRTEERAIVPALDDDVRAFAAELGVWNVGDRGRRVATSAGVVRAARGIDASLLDLEDLAGWHIAVADTDRFDFDAPLLARALQASPWAEATSTRFSAVRVGVLREPGERYLFAHDFAQLHEEPGRLAWLGQQLESARGSHDAWLVGPWLGVEHALAPRLRERLGVPVGETTSLPGGPAGARFAAGRERLFAHHEIASAGARVYAVEATGRVWTLQLAAEERNDGSPRVVVVDAVVLAAGGLVGGGLRLAEPGDTSSPGVVPTFRVPAPVALDGTQFATPGSLHGVDWAHYGVEALERVGIAAERGRVEGQRGLFAAGDCVSARSRTVLEAVRAGVEAARAALDEQR